MVLAAHCTSGSPTPARNAPLVTYLAFVWSNPCPCGDRLVAQRRLLPLTGPASHRRRRAQHPRDVLRHADGGHFLGRVSGRQPLLRVRAGSRGTWLDRAGSPRWKPSAIGLALLTLVLGLPTTIIDAYNTQDVGNRLMSVGRISLDHRPDTGPAGGPRLDPHTNCSGCDRAGGAGDPGARNVDAHSQLRRTQNGGRAPDLVDARPGVRPEIGAGAADLCLDGRRCRVAGRETASHRLSVRRRHRTCGLSSRLEVRRAP